jgi:hypothetical protein
MYYVETMADNSGYTNHRVTCPVVMGSPFDSEQVCCVSFQTQYTCRKRWPQSVDKRRQLHPAFYLSYSPFWLRIYSKNTISQ